MDELPREKLCIPVPTLKWKSGGEMIDINVESSRECNQPNKSNEDGKTKRSFLFLWSVSIVQGIQRLCGLWGRLVAKHPLWFVIACVLLVGLCGSGLYFINVVFVPYDLWVPEDSNFAKVISWTKENFPSKYRKHVGIWEAENVLTANVIQTMWALHQHLKKTTITRTNGKISSGLHTASETENNDTFKWQDVCFRFPANVSYEAKEFTERFWERDSGTFLLDYNFIDDWLGDLQETPDYVCYETSLLELWEYDEDVIGRLSDEDVIQTVNIVDKSQHYGVPRNFSYYLGGIERDKDGWITRATTTLHTWVTRINYNVIKDGEFEIDIGSGEKVDKSGMLWEKFLANEVDNFENPDIQLTLNAAHSTGVALFKALLSDSLWIVVGWTALIGYVVFTLGQPTKKNHRIFPALVGLLSIAFGIAASFGACSFIGIPYGSLNNVLPVLLVALGVDDMYVIVTAWDHVGKTDSLERRAQLTLENAGMAITVTSVTDILAFTVGASTSLPGLRWFCIYSAMGITMVYFLEVTLFLASMILNEQWIMLKSKDERCVKKVVSMHSIEQYSPDDVDKCAKKSLRYSIDQYSKGRYLQMWSSWLMNPPIRCTVISFTLILFVFSSLSVVFMEQEFNPMWLMPRSSKLYKWFNTIETTFPDQREKGYIYFQGVKLPQDLPTLKTLSSNLTNLEYIMKVDGWFINIDFEDVFKKYPELLNYSEEEQCNYLKRNLHIKYINEFYFNHKDKTHPCSNFRIDFLYHPLESHASKQIAMKTVRDLVEMANLSGTRGVYAGVFSQWERDGIILTELIRSLCIVISVVQVIMLVLLASVRGSLIVTICVIFTLIDVASFVHYWGLTINSISSIAFVLSVGICVDYAAHIVHEFLINEGSIQQRVTNALFHMGSAVLHGGFSTFLSFILLAPSESYIYNAYFKILSSVSVFGLFHSLVFLPIVLSFIGPDSYPKMQQMNPDTATTSLSDSPNMLKTDLSIYAIEIIDSPFYFTTSKSKCDIPVYTTPSASKFLPSHRKTNSLPSLRIYISDINTHGFGSEISPSKKASNRGRSLRHSSTYCEGL